VTYITQFLVRLDGVFDLRAAERVAEALACVRPGGLLHVDLAQVHEFHDVGIASLARTLGASGQAVRVVLSGLRVHQLRLLAYLEVDLEALAGRGSPLPA
jgi:anti-anti-sigma regulatory factor